MRGGFSVKSGSVRSVLRRGPLDYSGALVVVILCALLLLSACTPLPPDPSVTTSSGSSSSATGSTPSPSPVATAVPSSTPVYRPATAQGPAQNVPVPVLPEKAKEFSKAGLIAFAEHWYETLSYAYETGDVAPMQLISAPDCPSCERVKASVDSRYGDGGWLVGGLMIVHDSRSTFNEMADGTYQAVLNIQQEKVVSYNTDGSVDSKSDPSIVRPNIVIAKYADGQWTALRAEHLTKE